MALSAYVARRRGQRPDAPLTSCARASFLLGCGLSLLLLLGTWLGAVPLLRLAGVQSDYLSLALEYAFPALISLALSGPAIVLHGILTGVGDTRNVLAANVLGNGVNVVCNALLIYGLGHFPRLGIFGAGLGTAVGAGGTLTYTLALFLRRGCPASLRGAGRWLPERSYLRALGPLTAGTFLEQAAERAGMFTFSRLVAELGTTALSIHNICGSLCDIYYSFSQGLGKASLVQAGQALGSGRAGNLRQITTASRLAALWTGGGAMLLYLLLRVPLLRLYHLDGSDLALGCEIMLSAPHGDPMFSALFFRGLELRDYALCGCGEHPGGLGHDPCGTASQPGTHRLCGGVFPHQHCSGASDPHRSPGIHIWTRPAWGVDRPHRRSDNPGSVFYAGCATSFSREGKKLKISICILQTLTMR